jgi:hypothetical protein
MEVLQCFLQIKVLITDISNHGCFFYLTLLVDNPERCCEILKCLRSIYVNSHVDYNSSKK